jgi:hypothetical protein
VAEVCSSALLTARFGAAMLAALLLAMIAATAAAVMKTAITGLQGE